MAGCTQLGDDWTCGDEVHAKGLCKHHYEQDKHGRTPTLRGQSSPAARAASLIADVEWLLATGRPINQIGPAVGKTPQALHRWLYRQGRKDLASTCNPHRVYPIGQAPQEPMEATR